MGSEEEFRELLSYARRVAKMTDKVIYDFVKGSPKCLYDAATHLIKAGGKRLRPLATVLAGRMYGLPEELGVVAGASVEILHNFTLVHDDIIDNDNLRRGVPTVHVMWGVPTAIVAGDVLFSKSFEVLSRLASKLPADRVVKSVQRLAWAATTIAEGQALEFELSRRNDVSIEDYITMVYKKTAALFDASLVIGATLAGANDSELNKLSRYAWGVGIAFQIQDDILGLTSDEKVLGKPIYSDIREGKRTILVIHALNNLPESKKLKLLSILGKKGASREELVEAARIIESAGSIDYARKEAERYLREGLKALEETNPIDAKARELLKDLAIYVVKRRR